MSTAIVTPAERFELVSAIVGDPRCGRVHIAVAYLLFCKFYNAETGRCDPSVTSLARAAATIRRYAQQSLHDLEKWGYLTIKVGGGSLGKFGPTNAYTPSATALPQRPSATGDPQRPSATLALQQHDPQRPSATKPSIEPSIQTPACSEETATQFETFWRIYPKRGNHSNPKKPARAKFETALRHGADSEAIIRGAQNYAAAVQANGTEPRYVAQAVTWLNQERWTEYQEAPQQRPRAGMC
jgi:hypothetical protein